MDTTQRFTSTLIILWHITGFNASWSEDLAGGSASLIFDNDQVIIWDNMLKEEMWRLGDSQEDNHECETSLSSSLNNSHFPFLFKSLKRTVTNLTKVYTQEYENSILHVSYYRDFIFHDEKSTTAVIVQETYQRHNSTQNLGHPFNFTGLCVHFYKRQYRHAYLDNGTSVAGENVSVPHLLLHRNRYGKKLEFPISIVESGGGATCFKNITAYEKYPTLYTNISKLYSSSFQLAALRGHYTFGKRVGNFPIECDSLTISYTMSVNQMSPSYCPTFLSKVGNHSIQSLAHRFGGKIGLYEDYIDTEGKGKAQNVAVVYSYSLFGIATSAGKDAVYSNTSEFFSFLKQRARAQIALLDYARTFYDFKVPYSWGSKDCGAGLPLHHWEVYNLCQIGRYTIITSVQSGNQIHPKDLLLRVLKLIINHRRPLNQQPWFPHSFDENGDWLCPEFVLNTHLDSIHLLLMFSFLDQSFRISRPYGSVNATEDFPRLQEILDSSMNSLIANIDCFFVRTDIGFLLAYSCPEDGEAENAEIEPWMYGYHYYSTFLLAQVIEYAEAKGLDFDKVKLRSVLKEACKRTLAYARSPDPRKYFGKNADIIYICAFIVAEKNRTKNYKLLINVGGVPVVEAIGLGRHLVDFGPPDTLYLHKIPSVPVILFDIAPNSTFLANRHLFKTKGLAKIVHANPDFPYPTPENVIRSRFKRIFLLSNIGYDGLEIGGRGEIEVEAFSANLSYHSVYTKYFATEDPPFIIYSTEIPLQVRKISKRLSGLRAELKTKVKVKVSFRSKSTGDMVTVTRSCAFRMDGISISVVMDGRYLTIDAFSPTDHFVYISVLHESSRPMNFLDGAYQASVQEFGKEKLIYKNPVKANVGEKAFIVFNQTVLTRYFNVSWSSPSGKTLKPVFNRLFSPDIIEEFHGIFIRSVVKEDFGTYQYNFTSIDLHGKQRKIGGKVDLIPQE